MKDLNQHSVSGNNEYRIWNYFCIKALSISSPHYIINKQRKRNEDLNNSANINHLFPPSSVSETRGSKWFNAMQKINSSSPLPPLLCLVTFLTYIYIYQVCHRFLRFIGFDFSINHTLPACTCVCLCVRVCECMGACACLELSTVNNSTIQIYTVL